LVLQVDQFNSSSRIIKFDEKAYERAKTILLNEKIDVTGLNDFAWILLQSNHAKYALPLYEIVLERTKDKHERRRILPALFSTLMELGDWRRAEKILDEYLGGGSNDSRYIIHCFEDLRKSAEKAGATRDAKRIQKRLENLGQF
jgi:hypothetical protein